MTTIVVAGALANKHRYGGSQWVRMSWAESLMRLGFQVIFCERLHSGGDRLVFESQVWIEGFGRLTDDNCERHAELVQQLAAAR